MTRTLADTPGLGVTQLRWVMGFLRPSVRRAGSRLLFFAPGRNSIFMAQNYLLPFGTPSSVVPFRSVSGEALISATVQWQIELCRHIYHSGLQVTLLKGEDLEIRELWLNDCFQPTLFASRTFSSMIDHEDCGEQESLPIRLEKPFDFLYSVVHMDNVQGKVKELCYPDRIEEVKLITNAGTFRFTRDSIYI